MPYRRRKNYSRKRKFQGRGYRAHRSYGYFGKFGNDATKAIKMAGKALALINTEHKHIDVQNVTTTALLLDNTKIQQLNPVVQGTDDNNRIGNSVKNTSIYLREYYTNPSTTDVKIIRRLIVKWFSPNGTALPQIDDILQRNHICGPRNIDKAKMFKILADDIIYLPTQTNPRKLSEKYIKLSGDGSDDHTEYSATPASPVVNTNGYYIIHISNIHTDPTELEFYYRMRFIDN